MLGIGGKFASSKGMVAMPDLVGLSRSAAADAILNAGLRSGTLSSASTTNLGLDNVVESQTIDAGTLIDYETEVSFRFLRYQAPIPTTPSPTTPPPFSVSISSVVPSGRETINVVFNAYGYRSYKVTALRNGNPSDSGTRVFGPFNNDAGSVSIGLINLLCGSSYQIKVEIFSSTNGGGSTISTTSSAAQTFSCVEATPAPTAPPQQRFLLRCDDPTPCSNYEEYVSSTTGCNSSTKIEVVTYSFRRRQGTLCYYSDGSVETNYTACSDSFSRNETRYNCDGSLDCNNYLRTFSDTLPTGQCSTGFGRFNIGVFRDGCGKANVSTFLFCAPNPNAPDCSSCVSSYTYRTSDSSCASGTAWRAVCTHPSGCSPSQTDTKGGCDPVVENICRVSCTPWYRSSCKNGERFVTRRCSDCNGNNEYRETYYESC